MFLDFWGNELSALDTCSMYNVAYIAGDDRVAILQRVSQVIDTMVDRRQQSNLAAATGILAGVSIRERNHSTTDAEGANAGISN